MANTPSRPTDDEASGARAPLAAERGPRGTGTPWLWLVSLGLGSAWFVLTGATAEPGAGYEPSTSTWLALMAIVLAGTLIRRDTGIRFRRMGARATWLTVGILAATLALFGSSLGLVAADLRWAVAVPVLLAFGLTTWLARVAVAAADRG